MSLIVPSDYPSSEEYLNALEDKVEACRHYAVTLHESLDSSIAEVPNFNLIEPYLKDIESSIRHVRRIIKIELQGREANRQRQIEQTRKYGND